MPFFSEKNTANKRTTLLFALFALFCFFQLLFVHWFFCLLVCLFLLLQLLFFACVGWPSFTFALSNCIFLLFLCFCQTFSLRIILSGYHNPKIVKVLHLFPHSSCVLVFSYQDQFNETNLYLFVSQVSSVGWQGCPLQDLVVRSPPHSTLKRNVCHGWMGGVALGGCQFFSSCLAFKLHQYIEKNLGKHLGWDVLSGSKGPPHLCLYLPCCYIDSLIDSCTWLLANVYAHYWDVGLPMYVFMYAFGSLEYYLWWTCIYVCMCACFINHCLFLYLHPFHLSYILELLVFMFIKLVHSTILYYVVNVLISSFLVIHCHTLVVLNVIVLVSKKKSSVYHFIFVYHLNFVLGPLHWTAAPICFGVPPTLYNQGTTVQHY